MFAPLPVADATPGATAESLAALVQAGGTSALPALLAGLKASGIGIREPDGTPAFAPAEPNQGIVFEAWEVTAMARFGENGTRARLIDLATVVGSLIPALKGRESLLAQAIVERLRMTQQDSRPTVRFWAQFVAALGKASSSGDQSSSQPDAIELDGIQTSLVFRGLVAGSVSTAPTLKTNGNAGCQLSASIDSVSGGTARTNLSPLSGVLETLVAPAPLWAADWRGLFALSRLYFYFALNKLSTRSPSIPLGPGEKAKAVVDVRIDVDQRPLVTCIRRLLNEANLDLATRSDGALANTVVKWSALNDPVRGASRLSFSESAGLSRPSGSSQTAAATTKTDLHGHSSIGVRWAGAQQSAANLPTITRPANAKVVAQPDPELGLDGMGLARIYSGRPLSPLQRALLLLPIHWMRTLQLEVAEPVQAFQLDFWTELQINASTCPRCMAEVFPPFSSRRTPDHGSTLIRARVSGLVIPGTAVSDLSQRSISKPLDVTHYEIHGWVECDPSDSRPSPGPGDPFAVMGLSLAGDTISLLVDPGAPKESRPTCGGKNGEYLPGYFEAWQRLHGASLPYPISDLTYTSDFGGWEERYDQTVSCPRPPGALYGQCPDGSRVYGSFDQLIYRETSIFWLRATDLGGPALPFPGPTS